LNAFASRAFTRQNQATGSANGSGAGGTDADFDFYAPFRESSRKSLLTAGWEMENIRSCVAHLNQSTA
jgi:hypothetical protein